MPLAEQAIAQASTERTDLISFPECFIPGYRGMGNHVPPPDPVFLERAWSVIAAAGAKANLVVVLGTERVVDDALLISALVTNRDGTIAGFQDKVQLDGGKSSKSPARHGARMFACLARWHALTIEPPSRLFWSESRNRLGGRREGIAEACRSH